ncbi:hypothetical protein [Lentzea sp. E54]|uniref:hypothetical protein n=1 Tax=Lentzea xerophila TaxID=3435883 RepID=UPI003DA6BB43
MSVWAELIAKLQSLIRRILGAVGAESSAGDAIYARAVPDVVRVSEHYEFEQEISRNPSLDWKGEPSGKVEVTIPYDGAGHFGALARADVEEALDGPWSGRRPKEVRIGHLLFDSYGGSDLGRLLDLSGRNGAMPLSVPLPDDAGEFGADRLTCAIRHDYRPDRTKLKQYPVDVRVDLLDPDNAGLPEVDVVGSRDREIIESMPSRIERHVSFRPYLQLRMTVWVHLPKPPEGVVLQPKVSKVSLDWPTITSLRGLHLSKGAEGYDNDESAVWYNPLTRSIEWDDVPMTRVGEENADVHSYRSHEMNLWIKQPGELYAQSILDGHVEVEIPGYLLSGLGARLADANGRMPQDRQPESKTVIGTGLRLVLDDAFARRSFAPVQHLRFDEVIPEEERITDITTALSDRGFSVRPVGVAVSSPERRLLYATKSEGPDQMALWLFILGRRYEIQRETQMPDGQTFTANLDTGELRLFMGGTLARNSRELTHEMNALQQKLRTRFRSMRTGLT